MRSPSCRRRPSLNSTRRERRTIMKRIRFWGTRGSLPVSLTAAGVRGKLVAALRGASGRVFTTDGEIERYLDGLGLAVSGTYGGHSACVEFETGGNDYVLCDL